MAHTVLISILCPDRTGLIAALAGALFDLGANLGDTTFAVLGEGAEWTSVTEVPDEVSPQDLRAALAALPHLAEAHLTVVPFALAPRHGPGGVITHRIVLSGGDRPGLVARLAEVFVQYHANVVRLNAEQVNEADGSQRYALRIALSIPQDSAAACLATVANTAGELGLNCGVTVVGDGVA